MIPSELKRLFVSLHDCDVHYLLADGFTHKPTASLKFSKKIDFWLKPSLDNARRLIRALKIFGTPMHGIQAEMLAGPETQFTLPCHPYQLEFYTYIPSLEFEKSRLTREAYQDGSLLVSLLGRTDLAQARASLRRPQDDSDLNAVGWTTS